MKAEESNLFACLSCGGEKMELSIQDENGPAVMEGILRCPTCQRAFPIKDGVPRLVNGDELSRSPSRSFGFQWAKWLRGSFEKGQIYGSPLEKEINEFHHYTGVDPEGLWGKRVLDAGCGSGRLTRYLGTRGAKVVGMDVHAALADVFRYCQGANGVCIVQGSILQPPLKKQIFDLVWSEGVIHHTGNTPKAFDELSHLVKPGGRLFVWVYWKEENNIYRRVRNSFKIMHKLPMPILFTCCYLIASILFAGAIVRRLPEGLKGLKKVTPLRLHAFRLFDHLSPAYNTQHTESEVRGWFEKNGFTNIVRVGDLGVRGDKPN